MFTPQIMGLLNPIIQKEFVRYLGEQNFVSSLLSEIPIAQINGTIPVKLDNIAYDLSNENTGLAISSAIRQLPIPTGVLFKTESNKIRIGITEEYFDQMSVFAGSGAEAINDVGSFLGEQLAQRAGLIREKTLVDVVTDATLYGSANTITIAKTIATWTTDDFDAFVANFATMSQYLNRAVGNGLLTPDQMINPEYQLHVVFPQPIWNAMVGRWSALKNYVTLEGLSSSPGKDYKRLELGYFNFVTKGKVSIGMAVANGKQSNITGLYDPTDLTPLWGSDTDVNQSIYCFVTSTNKTKPASIMDLVFKKQEIKSTPFLSDTYYEARVRRTIVAANHFAFFKFNLKTK